MNEAKKHECIHYNINCTTNNTISALIKILYEGQNENK